MKTANYQVFSLTCYFVGINFFKVQDKVHNYCERSH